ncbi:hypothetical protein Bca101_060803 [Brassica carinata]
MGNVRLLLVIGEEFCTLTERAIEEPNLRRSAEMKNMLYDPLCFVFNRAVKLRTMSTLPEGAGCCKNKIPSSHYGHIPIFEAYQQHANSMTSVMKQQGDQQVLGGARNRWLE